MTDSNFTAIAVLGDRSGSMHGIKDDTEGAIAAFSAEQAAQPGKCTMRLAQFDEEYEVVYPSTPVADVPRYVLEPRGRTALYDAIARTITDFGAELAALPEDERPGKVIVVIGTDGAENASREHTAASVKALITEQTEKYGWTFVYFGANQDAVLTATQMGIPAGSALTYDADNVAVAAASVSSYVSRTRSAGSATFTDAEREGAI